MTFNSKDIGPIIAEIWRVVLWIAKFALVLLAVANVFILIGFPLPRIPLVDPMKLAALAVVFWAAN